MRNIKKHGLRMIMIKMLPEISHQYEQSLVVIKAIKLSSKITFLVGENGIGKSTYLKLLSGVLPNDHNILMMPFRFLPERVIFPRYISAKIYLDEMIHIDKTARKEACDKWIDILAFKQFIDYPIEALSKGNKQKLNLIQVLMCDVPLYLLDEPFSGLDKTVVETLIKALKSSNKQYIITTHIKHAYSHQDCEVITL